MQPIDCVKETGSLAAHQPLPSPFEELPEELILEIFSHFSSLQLPPLFQLSREFKRLAADRSLIRREMAACRSLVEQLLKKNKNCLPIEETHMRCEASPWRYLREMAGSVKKILEEMGVKELAAFCPPRAELEEARLVDKFIMQSFLDAWKKIIEKKVGLQGTVELTKDLAFTDESFDLFLKALEENRQPHKLVVEVDFDPKHVQMLFQRLAENRLHVKDLIITRDSDSPPAQAILHALMRILPSNTTLTGLHLHYCGIDDQQMQGLAQALLTKKNLAELKINDFTLTQAGLQTLAQMLKDTSSLKFFGLERAATSDIEPLMQEMNQFHLETLYLSQCQISSLAASRLAEAIRSNSRIKSLLISSSQIEKEDIDKLIQALKENRTIQEVQILNHPLLELKNRNRSGSSGARME